MASKGGNGPGLNRKLGSRASKGENGRLWAVLTNRTTYTRHTGTYARHNPLGLQSLTQALRLIQEAVILLRRPNSKQEEARISNARAICGYHFLIVRRP